MFYCLWTTKLLRAEAEIESKIKSLLSNYPGRKFKKLSNWDSNVVGFDKHKNHSDKQ